LKVSIQASIAGFEGSASGPPPSRAPRLRIWSEEQPVQRLR
jgi:hypothetical protein